MKFVERRPLSDPDAAARRIVEIANGVEAVQDGRIYIERVNEPFLAAGGSGDQFRAGIARAIALGWLWRHESGTYLKFTDSGAALFALIRWVDPFAVSAKWAEIPAEATAEPVAEPPPAEGEQQASA